MSHAEVAGRGKTERVPPLVVSNSRDAMAPAETLARFKPAPTAALPLEDSKASEFTSGSLVCLLCTSQPGQAFFQLEKEPVNAPFHTKQLLAFWQLVPYRL
jgi:hypothetical protein